MYRETSISKLEKKEKTKFKPAQSSDAVTYKASNDVILQSEGNGITVTGAPRCPTLNTETEEELSTAAQIISG
jgi:hypothetical protein